MYQYNILHCKPEATPEEQAKVNDGILAELLDNEQLQGLLRVTDFKGLKKVLEQRAIFLARSVHFYSAPNLCSNMQYHETMDIVTGEQEVLWTPALSNHVPNDPSHSPNVAQIYSSLPAISSIDASEPSYYYYRDSEEFPTGAANKTSSAAAEDTEDFFSDRSNFNRRRIKPAVNAATASSRENGLQTGLDGGSRSWRPNPDKALFMPQGTCAFPCPTELTFDKTDVRSASRDTPSPPYSYFLASENGGSNQGDSVGDYGSQ